MIRFADGGDQTVDIHSFIQERIVELLGLGHCLRLQEMSASDTVLAFVELPI